MKKFLLTLFLGFTLFSCNKTNDQIIVYTNSGSNGRAEFLKEEAKNAGFDINIVEAGGTDISNRLLSEKNKPIADVVFGLNPLEYEKLKKENIFLQYTPTWANEVEEGLSDPEGYYNAVTVTHLLAIYNPQIIKGDDIPKDWVDLATQEKYHDKYHLLKLSSGTGKAVLASIISRYKDESGELNISKEGWEIVKKYIQNGHVHEGDDDFFGNLMSGKRPITMIWSSGAYERSKHFNFEIGVMKPEIGLPAVVEQVALINKEGNLDKTKEFINWIGSADFQAKWSEKFGTVPANKSAKEKISDDLKEFIKDFKSQKLDWKFISENIDSWIEKVELEYNK